LAKKKQEFRTVAKFTFTEHLNFVALLYVLC